MKQSSDRLSTLAARVLQTKPVIADQVHGDSYNELLAVAKMLAGSVLAQDETPLRRLKRKLFG